jgi:hypothetical protein
MLRGLCVTHSRCSEADDRADQFMFLTIACQYYVTARFAMHAECMPVCGNLFHHAVEMFLKAGLAPKRKLSELKKMRHQLKKLWRAFKVDFPNPTLKRHDNMIASLDKFEAIRYPDATKEALGMTGQWCGPAASVKSQPAVKTSRQYGVIVSEIDDLIVDVCKECSQHPGGFIHGPAALEAIIRHNKHSDILTRIPS